MALMSIIIPAHDEEKYIARAIKSVERQSYSDYETIVVANACSDNTAKVARGLADIVIETKKPGAAHAKNLGVRKANGSVFVFMDGDSVIEEHLLETVYSYIQKGYNCGKAKIRPIDDNRIRAEYYCLLSEIVSHMAKISPIDDGNGGFIFITKELFKKVDGFNEDLLVMEDVEFGTRMRRFGKYKFITESYIETSMRRFVEEGYIKCFFEDCFHGILPEGKTRQRWNIS